MVGKQVYDWFLAKGKTFGYDVSAEKNKNTWEETVGADCFFVCVPTPYDGKEYNLSYLEEAISKIPDGKIVIIKSTVSPGTTDYFQNKYPNKIFMFNPEFLTELSAKNDFGRPDMQILGVPHQGYELASQIMLLLPPAPIMQIVSPVDAEWVKKLRNAFYATKVVFFNQMYDIISNSVGDYETIRSIVVHDPRIGNSHSFIFHKGGRGGGGVCLPKDLNSLVGFAKRYNIHPEFLEKVMEINENLLKQYPKTYVSDSHHGTQGLHRKSSVESVKA